MELEASEDRSPESRRPAEPASSDASDVSANLGNVPSVIYRTSDEIFKGFREIVIQHSGAKCRLRITASDKLILTK